MLAEQLVGEARARRPRAMAGTERTVLCVSAVAFVAVAMAIAVVMHTDREANPLLMAALVVSYGIAFRVRFEFGNGYVMPEQLVFVPVLLLIPLPYVPVLVGTARVLAAVPEFVQNNWSRDRWIGQLADAWYTVGPVLALAALGAGEPDVALVPAYAIALAAQLACDLLWSLVRDKLVDDIPFADTVRDWLGVARVDAALTPVALVAAISAVDQPAWLLAIAPILWLLAVFSRERQEKYTATLELHRAYRGTVMLLTDVVEFDDHYTADHSRSVVDLVHAVADELAISATERQELEFAALLHDVGKIAIPKEIINKPGPLTDEEFELMKTHTIEGQYMLDRVGGLLARVGEIVRSCHERWDGKGYPDGLAGEEIPLPARIVFACDAYNAMTTDRAYRAALPHEAALAELKTNAGTQFDPQVVAALAKVVETGEPALSAADGIRVTVPGAPLGVGAL